MSVGCEMSVKAMGRPFGCVVQGLRVGRGGRAGMEPGVNRLVQAHATRDRVDHKDDKRDEGEHDDDFLSRSHAGDLILARRLLGGCLLYTSSSGSGSLHRRRF